MAANDKKDTIYVDVDDEITGIIDKVQNSSGKVVALVLPKRAAVFQSIVNMKLLKRAADGADKNLVLITTEAGLMPLAGVAGIHVAKTLSSKPELPTAPPLAEEGAEEAVNEDGELTAANAGDQPVGALAGKPPADTGMETLTLDDESLPPETPAAAPKKDFTPPSKKAKGAKDKKKFKIPDFNRFRLLIIAGIAVLILLILFLFLAIKVWPKATITVDTDSQKIDSNVSMNLSTTATSLDPESGTIPAKLAQQQKTYSQQVATTGQKNNGNRASGSVNLVDCSNDDVTLPAGTGLSSNGNTYITQQTVTVGASSFKHGSCQHDSGATVAVIAQNPGSAYNGATSFTVAGHSELSGTPSSAISGGTDNIVHSVNQNDIDNAKSKISTSDPAVKQTLESQLKDGGYYVIDATYSSGTPAVTQSANVGTVADIVTVTETVTYSVFGVHKSDLRTLVENDVDSQIDTSKQKLQNDGIDQANFNVENQSATGAQVAMSTKAVAGPDVNVASIQKDAAGQKAGKIKGDLQGNPGIKSVDVNLSPFWVSTVPKNTDKIHVIIAEPKSK